MGPLIRVQLLNVANATKITDMSIVGVAQCCVNLKALILSGCWKVTDAGKPSLLNLPRAHAPVLVADAHTSRLHRYRHDEDRAPLYSTADRAFGPLLQGHRCVGDEGGRPLPPPADHLPQRLPSDLRHVGPAPRPVRAPPHAAAALLASEARWANHQTLWGTCISGRASTSSSWASTAPTR
jgi:hypothetical protein